MNKDFDNWNILKKHIDYNLNRPPYYKEGEIWLVNLGCNIGVENNGKGDTYLRPVLVFKKVNKYSCIVIPISSQKKKNYFYKEFDFRNNKNILLFNQIRSLDVSRFTKLVGQVSDINFNEIKDSFIKIIK